MLPLSVLPHWGTYIITVYGAFAVFIAIKGVSTIAQYGILRFSKHKGGSAKPIEAHHERQKEKYASNSDIDTSRSKYNYHLIQPSESYRNEIDRRIDAAGCRTRKDSIRFVDTLVTASPEFFKGKKPAEVKAYFDYAAEFLFKQLGKQNVISAVVHMDEKTPHLHLCFVPLTEDNRLSARDILGNRARLSKWQDDFHAHMVKKYEDLERGESAYTTRRKHIPPRLFKQAARLSKQAERIEQTLAGINMLNAGQKRDEVLAMLDKWFPQMEDFTTYLRKYKGTIMELEKENQQLDEKAQAASENKIYDRLQFGKLQMQYNDLKRKYEAIPEDERRRAEAARRGSFRREQQPDR